MEPAKRLREKLQRRELTTGLLVTDHIWTDLVEITQRAGLDYLIVDMEHGPVSTELAAEVCATGRRLNFAVLIRPRTNDYAGIRLAADLGPCGFLLASVDGPEQLDIVRDGLYLPPRGQRRPGGSGNRWVRDFTVSTWQREVEQDFIVLPQIETRAGLERLDEIASHELTTAMAIGPYDLSAELGVCGEMDSPRLKEAMLQIRAAGHRVGKETWLIGGAPEKLVQEGWRFICLGEPTWILLSAMRERLAQAHQGLASHESVNQSTNR